MPPRELTMPKLSDSMAEAVIVRWLKPPGDAFARGEALVEVETDKATVVYEAEADGMLGAILVPEGATAAVGEPIATLANGDGARRADRTARAGERRAGRPTAAPRRAAAPPTTAAARPARRRSRGAPRSSSASRCTASPAPARAAGSRATTSSGARPTPARRPTAGAAAGAARASRASSS